LLSDLPTSMARHFLYSIIQHEGQISIQIVNKISKLRNDQVYEFLMTLLAHMDGMLNDLESQLFDYNKFKHVTCDCLRNPYPNDISLGDRKYAS